MNLLQSTLSFERSIQSSNDHDDWQVRKLATPPVHNDVDDDDRIDISRERENEKEIKVSDKCV